MLSLMLVPLGICRAFDLFGEFLDKIPTKGPSKWVKSVDRVVSYHVVLQVCICSFQERHNVLLS